MTLNYLRKLAIATLGLMAVTTCAATAPKQAEAQLAHFTGITPAPGSYISVEGDDVFGLASILFNFDCGIGALNSEEELYAILTHDGETIAIVPSTNYKLTRYDNFFADVWSMAFWEQPAPVALAPGTFHLSIPEGFFIVEGRPSEALEADYFIRKPGLAFEPAAGAVDKLSEITFIWNDMKEVRIDLSDPEAQPYFLSMNASILPPSFTVSAEGNSVTMKLAEPVSAPGTWYAGLPQGKISVSADGVDFSTTRETPEVVYSIAEDFKARPELQLDDPVRTLPGSFKMRMPEGYSLSIVNNLRANTLHHVEADGTMGGASAVFNGWKADGDRSLSMTNQLGKDFTMRMADGKYRLVLAESLFAPYPGERTSPELTYDFEVINLTSPFTATPADGAEVKSFESMEITYPEAVKIGTAQPVFITDGVATYLGGIRVKEGDDKTVVITPIRPITREGHYLVRAESGTVQGASAGRGGKTNTYDVYQHLKVTDNPGSVVGIEAMDELVTVYDLQGVLLLENEPREALYRLDAGIYIVNGRKVLLRR